MRIMALDLGTKTIGVAVSDPLGYTAQGIKTIRRSGKKEDLAQLADLIKSYEVQEIIIGFPKNMNGTVGFKAQEVNSFIDILKKEFNLDVRPWDERLSTKAGERMLIEGDVSRKKRKKVIDTVAACLILQNYLDRKQNE
ncbi:MAG: Holliday junction resolvase RuvX [bacterium]